ncbi:hypothetical protein ACFVYD_36275 [Streptomyces sp. NPDC058301]|uniref:hypothetical protein n=1 Tax=Streptomyces sp. NPDC058301 TaxID=3346436 RepID=UPI0036ECDCCF
MRRYRREDTGQIFFLCPECESVWPDGEDITEETDLYLSEFLRTGDPAKDWQIIAPCD